MSLFRYKAIDSKGKTKKGVIDADSLTEAKKRLQKEQILVIEIVALRSDADAMILRPEQLLAFTRELAQLLKAGLPLYESLLTLEEKRKHTKTHALFVDLCDRLKNGDRFSSILASYPKTFDNVYISLIVSAEQSSRLSEALDRLTVLIGKRQKLKKQLLSSLAYPAFLGGFCIFVILALFLFVIPSMKELFEGRQLHPLTQTVLFLSETLQKNGIALAGIGVVTVAAIFSGLRFPSVKRKIGLWTLQLPFCKKILLESSLVRFFSTLSMLLAGGVPLVEALGFSQKASGNYPFEELIAEARRSVPEGKKMSDLFGSASFIPPLVVRMLTIGEETGNMRGMTESLAEIYEEELDKNLLRLVTFLQPAVLLFLGAVVGLVVLSILLPLTDVSSFVS